MKVSITIPTGKKYVISLKGLLLGVLLIAGNTLQATRRNPQMNSPLQAAKQEKQKKPGLLNDIGNFYDAYNIGGTETSNELFDYFPGTKMHEKVPPKSVNGTSSNQPNSSTQKVTPRDNKEKEPSDSDLKKAIAMYNTAKEHYKNKQYESALKLYHEALAIFEGCQHLDVATTLNNIGLVYRKQGQHEDALTCYRKALAVYKKKLLDSDHPHVATTLNNIAGVCRSQGRHEEALKYYRRALAIKEKKLGSDHAHVATIQGLIKTVEKEKRNKQQSVNSTSSNHPNSSLPSNPSPQKDIPSNQPDPSPQIVNTQDNKEKELSNSDLKKAIAVCNTAKKHYKNKQYESALKLYHQALEIFERNDHLDVATTLDNIAVVYKSQENYEEALKYYRRALAIQKKKLGSDHPSVATTRNLIRIVEWKNMVKNFLNSQPEQQRRQMLIKEIRCVGRKDLHIVLKQRLMQLLKLERPAGDDVSPERWNKLSASLKRLASKKTLSRKTYLELFLIGEILSQAAEEGSRDYFSWLEFKYRVCDCIITYCCLSEKREKDAIIFWVNTLSLQKFPEKGTFHPTSEFAEMEGWASCSEQLQVLLNTLDKPIPKEENQCVLLQLKKKVEEAIEEAIEEAAEKAVKEAPDQEVISANSSSNDEQRNNENDVRKDSAIDKHDPPISSLKGTFVVPCNPKPNNAAKQEKDDDDNSVVADPIKVTKNNTDPNNSGNSKLSEPTASEEKATTLWKRHLPCKKGFYARSCNNSRCSVFMPGGALHFYPFKNLFGGKNVHSDTVEKRKKQSVSSAKKKDTSPKKDNPSTQKEDLQKLFNAAAACYKKEDYEKALNCYGKALHIQKELYGSDHPEVAAIRNLVNKVKNEIKKEKVKGWKKEVESFLNSQFKSQREKNNLIRKIEGYVRRKDLHPVLRQRLTQLLLTNPSEKERAADNDLSPEQWDELSASLKRLASGKQLSRETYLELFLIGEILSRAAKKENANYFPPLKFKYCVCACIIICSGEGITVITAGDLEFWVNMLSLQTVPKKGTFYPTSEFAKMKGWASCREQLQDFLYTLTVLAKQEYVFSRNVLSILKKKLREATERASDQAEGLQISLEKDLGISIEELCEQKPDNAAEQEVVPNNTNDTGAPNEQQVAPQQVVPAPNEQDASQQDAFQQDAFQQDASQQDASQQDASQQDASQQDASQQDALDNENNDKVPENNEDIMSVIKGVVAVVGVVAVACFCYIVSHIVHKIRSRQVKVISENEKEEEKEGKEETKHHDENFLTLPASPF